MRMRVISFLCALAPIHAVAWTSNQPIVGGATLIKPNDDSAADASYVGEPLSHQGSVNIVRDAPLLQDLEKLSHILGQIVQQEDASIHDLYQTFRQLGLDRANGDTSALSQMIQQAQQLTAPQALGVMRTFSIMLNLVNSAEVHHRNRMTRQHDTSSLIMPNITAGPLPLSDDSMRLTMEYLLNKGIAPQDILHQLCHQKVEIVLTAHPTQVQRKSLLRKYRKISECLMQYDKAVLVEQNQFDVYQTQTDLTRIISSIWGADEIRRLKPSPQEEAAGGNAVVESILWEAVPAYLRKLDQQCQLTLGLKLPVDAVPIQFSSWIGGDRDGNPNVTPQVTLEVVLQQRLRAARLLLHDLYVLLGELGISYRFSDRLLEYAATIKDSHHEREKYRRVLGHLIQRLSRTAREYEQQLAALSTGNQIPLAAEGQAVPGWEKVEPIVDLEDIMEPLQIMRESLIETGFGLVADGHLLDVMRRLRVFGLSLLPLDIREESTKHTEALDAVTRWLGIGSYKEWDESARLTWLQSELANKRPLYPLRDLDKLGFDPSIVTTLRTFETISQLHPSSMGAYVISQAQTASDVLAVMLLQKNYGMIRRNGNLMRVVPLFETLDDLLRSSSVLETLFTIGIYRGEIQNQQEVMVGYSDSAKDAGRLAASLVLYNSQVAMAQVAEKHNIALTFFHGKGGTVGRGGNPSVYRAILSHPPHTVKGRFRVTEQGEMIMQNFGTVWIAERTLDIYTAAVCREAFEEHVIPSAKWLDQMQTISDKSCEDYRQLVRHEPRFVPYFRQATPELELGSLNIGSRPAKRNPKGGIESLRAIPWTFAWTQTRTLLSAWLGVGAGLKAETPEQLSTMREMYKEWPWFRETIDLIAMILSKTDFSISRNYDEQLVDKKNGLDTLGEEVKTKLVETRQAVLAVTESKNYGGAHSELMRASSTIRHPYVDPINVLQAELLKRFRSLETKSQLSPEEEEEKEILKDALIISINGIAQGMRNSG